MGTTQKAFISTALSNERVLRHFRFRLPVGYCIYLVPGGPSSQSGWTFSTRPFERNGFPSSANLSHVSQFLKQENYRSSIIAEIDNYLRNDQVHQAPQTQPFTNIIPFYALRSSAHPAIVSLCRESLSQAFFSPPDQQPDVSTAVQINGIFQGRLPVSQEFGEKYDCTHLTLIVWFQNSQIRDVSVAYHKAPPKTESSEGDEAIVIGSITPHSTPLESFVQPTKRSKTTVRNRVHDNAPAYAQLSTVPTDGSVRSCYVDNVLYILTTLPNGVKRFVRHGGRGAVSEVYQRRKRQGLHAKHPGRSKRNRIDDIGLGE